jgi:hypothetical protein
MPLAQLLKVPSTRRPLGSAAVFSSVWPATGPPTRDRRERGDAARPRRRPHDLPLAVLELDLDHRDTVRGLRLAHLLRAPGLHAVGVQQAVVDVLVVHHEQAARRAVLREEVDAVVMHAHLGFLLGGGVARVLLEGRVLA